MDYRVLPATSKTPLCVQVDPYGWASQWLNRYAADFTNWQPCRQYVSIHLVLIQGRKLIPKLQILNLISNCRTKGDSQSSFYLKILFLKKMRWVDPIISVWTIFQGKIVQCSHEGFHKPYHFSSEFNSSLIPLYTIFRFTLPSSRINITLMNL